MRNKTEQVYDDADFGYDEDEDDRRHERRRRRSDDDRRHAPGPFGRIFRLVRFLVFILPLSLLLIGSFLVDCRNRSGNGFLPEVVRTSACAREDLTGRFSDLEQTMRTITRAIH